MSTYSVDLNDVFKKCRPRARSSISTLIHTSKTIVDLIKFDLITPSDYESAVSPEENLLVVLQPMLLRLLRVRQAQDQRPRLST